MRNKLSHNDLWRAVQREFEKKKDGFSNKTFEKTLKNMVEQGLVYKEKDRESKLGKVWYFTVIDFVKIEEGVIINLETKLHYYNDQLKKFEKNFSKYDLYEKARRLGRFFILLSLADFDINWFTEVYSKNSEMKKRTKEIKNMKKRLDNLFQKSKSKNDEIRQLIVKGFESDEQAILDEIYTR